MIDLPQNIPAADASHHSLTLRALRVLAWPVSGLIGWWWMHKEARDSLYDTVKHAKAFEKIRKQKHWGNINTIVETSLSNGSSVICPLAEEHAAFGKDTTTFFRELGVRNTLDYMRGIHRNEAMKALMTGGGAASIALGVMLTVADNKHLEKWLTRLEKDPDGPSVP